MDKFVTLSLINNLFKITMLKSFANADDVEIVDYH